MITEEIEKQSWIFPSNVKIDLLDYVLDENGEFWIIVELHEDSVKAFKIYQLDDASQKLNHWTNKTYSKMMREATIVIPNKIKYIFKPREFYKVHKDNLPPIWKEFALALNEAGIADDDIGVFGSYLIGFDITKDVDFVVYGNKNLEKVYKNIDLIKNRLNATSISPLHIEYQYNKHKHFYSDECDLFKIIGRNWSGVQIKEGVLSTIRFIDIDHQVIPNIEGEKKKIICRITNGLPSTAFPRRVPCEVNGEEYLIYSSNWKYQSFARTGDLIELYGKVDDNKKAILLEDREDYIKFL